MKRFKERESGDNPTPKSAIAKWVEDKGPSFKAEEWKLVAGQHNNGRIQVMMGDQNDDEETKVDDPEGPSNVVAAARSAAECGDELNEDDEIFAWVGEAKMLSKLRFSSGEDEEVMGSSHQRARRECRRVLQ